MDTLHYVLCNSCPSQSSNTHLPFTLNDQMCCSCPIGPRAASHGQKLITEGNGKMLHLQTVQWDFFSLLANCSASHVAINLICVKMKSIDQLNNGMITSLFFTALKSH